MMTSGGIGSSRGVLAALAFIVVAVAASPVAVGSPAHIRIDDFVPGAWYQSSLPALSADGSRVALPATRVTDGEKLCVSHDVVIVPVGQSEGEHHPLTPNPCADWTTARADIEAALPAVNELLRAGGFETLRVVTRGRLSPGIDIRSAAARPGQVTAIAIRDGSRVEHGLTGTGDPRWTGAVLAGNAAYVAIRWQAIETNSVAVERRWHSVPLADDPPTAVAQTATGRAAASERPGPRAPISAGPLRAPRHTADPDAVNALRTSTASEDPAWLALGPVPGAVVTTAVAKPAPVRKPTSKRAVPAPLPSTAAVVVDRIRRIGDVRVFRLRIDPAPADAALGALSGDACIAIVNDWWYSGVPCRADTATLAALPITGTAVAGRRAGEHRGAVVTESAGNLVARSKDPDGVTTELTLSAAGDPLRIAIARTRDDGVHTVSAGLFTR